MASDESGSFPPEVAAKLKTYVYRLIDPRNGETFYVGKGRKGFEGHEAPDAIRRLYVNKRVPDEFRKRGAASPIKYTWLKSDAE